MRNDATDTARAVVLAVLVHVAIAALFLLSMWWADRTRPAEAAGGMAAEVVEPGTLSAAMRRTMRQEVELPEPEPEPEPEVTPPETQPAPQEMLPQPADIDQDEVVDAPTPVAATETQVQDEKRRQAQVDLTTPPKQREQQATPPPPQVDEAKLAAIRRQRAAQIREQRLALERAQQVAELRERQGGSAAEESARSDAAASGGDSSDLQARYVAALSEAIRAKWKRPGNIDRVAGLCRLVITQSPGGLVREARTEEPCSYDEAARRSIESAVLMAQPLPYEGFESVFKRDIAFRFRDE